MPWFSWCIIKQAQAMVQHQREVKLILHVWLFRLHTLGKLILHVILLSIKQNLSHPWFLGLYVFGKLMFYDIFLMYPHNPLIKTRGELNKC